MYDLDVTEESSDHILVGDEDNGCLWRFKMRDDTGIIKAGMAIIFSSGKYSDYSFGQVYIALQDFNYMEEAKKFYMEELEKDINTYVDSEDFENYLISKGFLGICDYREIHVGDYSFFDEDEWLKEFRK